MQSGWLGLLLFTVIVQVYVMRIIEAQSSDPSISWLHEDIMVSDPHKKTDP